MKKIISAVFIAAVLLLSASTEVRAKDEADNRLLRDLCRYMYESEVVCSDILWVIDAIDRFDRERNWESLQLARAALTIASKDIEICELPKPKLTAEDRRNFMKRGIDVSFMVNIEASFKLLQKRGMTNCMSMNTNLMDAVFLKDEWQLAMRRRAVERKEINLRTQERANMADWILASLNDPEQTKKFNGFMATFCPKTHAFQRKELESPEKIEASQNEVVSQLNDVVMEYAQIVGALRNLVNTRGHANETGNMELIRKNIMTISDMPVMIPSPAWLNYNDVRYYWKKDGEIQPIPKACTELERIPDLCIMKIEGVSLEQVKAYQKGLHDMKLPALELENKPEKLTLYYRVGGSEFSIHWENGKADILMTEKPFCFVPILYLRMMKK